MVLLDQSPCKDSYEHINKTQEEIITKVWNSVQMLKKIILDFCHQVYNLPDNNNIDLPKQTQHGHFYGI